MMQMGYLWKLLGRVANGLLELIRVSPLCGSGQATFRTLGSGSRRDSFRGLMLADRIAPGIR